MAAASAQLSRAVARPRAELSSRQGHAFESRASTSLRAAPIPRVAAATTARLPAPRAAAIEVLFEEAEVPTPTVPSTRMMADFLVTYGRMLKRFAATGDAAAVAGANVLERVRAGVMMMLDSTQHTAEWDRDERELEACLVELQRDIDLIERYHGKQPARLVVEMTSLRCMEAASLLQRL